MAEAVARGAQIVVTETVPDGDLPYLLVENARKCYATMAANWFHRPADSLTMLAVTGTNGKTTTAFLLKHMLETVAGLTLGLIGTNQTMIGDLVLEAERTTPEPYVLHGLLRRMLDAGCSHVVMEVSSHGLSQERVHGIWYRAAVFTNLTRDHLDYHGSMDAYRDAKAKLFSQCETGLFNLDDAAGSFYAAHSPCASETYSENKLEADLLAKNIRLFPTRVEFEALGREGLARVRLPIPGGFSIYNALAALSVGQALGLPLAAMAASLREAPGVRGRIEVVPTPAPYTVLIDYAHTPDALENILYTAGELHSNRLICLFGCGGDRDRGKRAVMGSIAAAHADVLILTSDNPRSEDPDIILDEIAAGIPADCPAVYREVDRRRAIALALSLGREGDVIVLAGKGHETYQEVDGVFHHLDEREETLAYFEAACPP